MPIILATWETRAGRLQVWGQLGQLSETLSQKKSWKIANTQGPSLHFHRTYSQQQIPRSCVHFLKHNQFSLGSTPLGDTILSLKSPSLCFPVFHCNCLTLLSPWSCSKKKCQAQYSSFFFLFWFICLTLTV